MRRVVVVVLGASGRLGRRLLHVDILIVGSGLCGLAIAVTAAQRGLIVRCVGDGRPGASLANFGQLHSGAVYAPVLPDLPQACRLHRSRWHDLVRPAQVGESSGLALFETVDAVERYRAAWHRIGIDASEVDPRAAGPFPPPAAAFRLPDHSVHLPTLHAELIKVARECGVPPVLRQDVTLHRDPGQHTGLGRPVHAACRPGGPGHDPPAGWSPAANLVVALPGKWTTAWHCADQVVDAIR